MRITLCLSLSVKPLWSLMAFQQNPHFLPRPPRPTVVLFLLTAFWVYPILLASEAGPHRPRQSQVSLLSPECAKQIISGPLYLPFPLSGKPVCTWSTPWYGLWGSNVTSSERLSLLPHLRCSHYSLDLSELHHSITYCFKIALSRIDLSPCSEKQLLSAYSVSDAFWGSGRRWTQEQNPCPHRAHVVVNILPCSLNYVHLPFITCLLPLDPYKAVILEAFLLLKEYH